MLKREFEGTSRVKGVPRRAYNNVVLKRDNPTRLQSGRVIVDSSNDYDEAQHQADRCNDDDWSNGAGEFIVEECY